MTIRWGIIGLGNIAHRFAGDLVSHAANASLQAVASRDPDRARLFAQQYSCQSAYGDYLSLVCDPNVDCIYVSTIHPQHRNVVELCLTHGKNVLVEKPAFTSCADWDAMAALARKNNLLMAEAMKSMTFPAYRKLVSFLEANPVNLTSVSASFGGIQPFDARNRLFNPESGGGATLDVAVYPLWLFHDICRRSNTPLPALQAYLTRHYPLSQVEDHAEFSASDRVSAFLGGSLSRDLPRHAEITGDDLSITISEKWWNPCRIEINFRNNRMLIDEPLRGAGMVYEIEHISDLIIQGKTESEWLPAQISRQVIQLMERSVTNFSA